MAAKAKRPASGVREHVSRLTAARDALDADQAERRRREEAAFARYAEAAARAETIAGEREAELARLDAERDRVRERARERLDEVEAEQRAVLAELNAGGRSAEELAALFEVPTKRVRTLLRAAKDAEPAAATADSVATDERTAAATAQPGPAATASTATTAESGRSTSAADTSAEDTPPPPDPATGQSAVTPAPAG